MSYSSEIEVLRGKLDDLAMRIASSKPCNPEIKSSIKRIERMLLSRRRTAEEQMQYFQDVEAEGEELCADYLSALHFEMAIIDRLDDLLNRIVSLAV